LSASRGEGFDRFDLDDHPILDNRTGPKADVDANRPGARRDNPIPVIRARG
jgi:hypothetical protein